MLRKLFVFLLLLCLLTGCDSQAEPTTPTSTAPTFTEPEETTAVPTEPEVFEFEAVNYLSSYTYDFESYTSYCPLDERTVLFHTVEYGPETDEDFSSGITRLTVVDLYTDTVINQLTLAQELNLPAFTPLGYIPLCDYENNCYYLLDHDLRVIRTFHAEDMFGCLSKDMRYYYLSGQKLFCYDTLLRESSPVTLDHDLRFRYIDSYDPASNTLLLSACTQYFGTDYCQAAIDLDTGEFTLLTDLSSGGVFTESGVCFQIYKDSSINTDIFYADWGSDTLQVFPESIPNYFGWHIPYSDYYFSCPDSYDPDYGVAACDLFRIGEQLESLSLHPLLENQNIIDLTALPGGNLLAVMENDGSFRIALLCPDKMEFSPVMRPSATEYATLDTGIAEAYLAQRQLKPLPETLTEVRQMADELEEEFGITILLSNQCADAAGPCSFPMVTTDLVGWENEADYIRDGLTNLRTALEKYPEGFFRQFRNEAGECGLLVLLVEDIQSENDAIGVAYEMGDWYPIAVDVSWGEMVATYCHEIWHATESKITGTDYWLLNGDVWDSLNPKDFEYSYDNTTGYIDDTKWTYISGGCGTESYFVDAYSRVNAKEDRARLMEYIMAYEYTAEEMMEAPVLHQKLEVLCRAIREVFDTTGWTDVYWERFHDIN